MFKSCVMPFLVFMSCFVIKAQNIYAFDPFTIMTAMGASSSILSASGELSNSLGLEGFSEMLSEGSDVLNEGTEISQEFNSDLESNELSEKAEKLKALNYKLKDIKSTSGDLKLNLDSDINQVQKLSEKLKQAKKVIRLSKKLAGLFGLKTKGADKVATLQQVKTIVFELNAW